MKLITEYKEHLKQKYLEYLTQTKWQPKQHKSVSQDKSLFVAKKIVSSDVQNKKQKTNNAYMLRFFVPFSKPDHSGYDFVIDVHQKMYGSTDQTSNKNMVSDEFSQNGTMLPLNMEDKDVVFRVTVEHNVKIMTISDRIFDIVGHIRECPLNELIPSTSHTFNVCYYVLKDINQSIIDQYKLTPKTAKKNQVKAKINMSGWLVVPCSSTLYDHYNQNHKNEIDFDKLWDRIEQQRSQWNGYMVFHFMDCDPKIPSILNLSQVVVEKHMISQLTSVLKHCTL